MSEPTDDALLEALRQGDERAMETLLTRHAPAVLRFGARMCRDPEDARDVLQETLLAAARGLKSFRGGSSLTTWLFAIARSFCIKKRRASKFAPSAPAVPLDDIAGERVDAGGLPEPVMAAVPAPDERAEGRELGEALEEAIRALEPPYREVLVLRDVEGLSAPEVAQVLGIGVDAVKSRLHRARLAVRDRLEPWVEPLSAASPSSSSSAASASGRGAAAPGRDCGDIGKLFSRYLEGEIGAAECEAMQAHVAGCAACGPACDAFKRVVSLCRTSAGQPVPTEVQVELRRAIRAAMRGA